MIELSKEVGEFTYSKLRGGERGERCIEKAKIWLITRFKFCGRKPEEIDYNDTIIKEIIAKRAAYELYSMSEQELTAQDKKEDALELLAGILGPLVYQSSYTEPVSSVTPKAMIQVARREQKKDRWAKYG